MGFGRATLPKPAPVSTSASQHATACGLRLIIPSPTPCKPAQGVSSSCCGRGLSSRRGRRKASVALLPQSRVFARCNDRHEAAPMASSLDTTSTLASVPIERLCFVDVSGEGRMPVGADAPLQLGVWATVSKRGWSTIFAAPTPRSSREIHSSVTNASYSRLGVVYIAECWGSWRTSEN